MPDIDETQLMWLEEDGEDEEPQQEQLPVRVMQPTSEATAESKQREAITALEEELQRTRKELMDVRKELAAKTVQLSRKEVLVSQEKVAELAANVASEKDKQLTSLAAHVEQLEVALGQKEEELEESRRLYNAQKRALREALAAAAEAEAAERQADEARARTAVAQVVEDELDRLQHELALLQARYDLEMRARDAELQSLRSELQAANTNRKQAVAAAEAALTEAWQAELGRATEEATARASQLEAEVARVRQQMEDHARSGDTVALAGELASMNQQKVAIQREFDAFREMATAAAREHREAAARLLEENATLKSRLAARAFQDVQAGFKPQSKVFTALTGTHGSPHAGAGPGSPGSSPGLSLGLGAAPGSGGSLLHQLPEVLVRLDRQRKGLLPALAVGGVVLLFVLVAVIRAAAVTRWEHRGGLCFLAHLGINVGPGCGPKHLHSVAEAAGEKLGHLLEETPRVHDVEAVAEAAAAGARAAGEAGAAASDAEAGAEGQGERGGGAVRVADTAIATDVARGAEAEAAVDAAVEHAEDGRRGEVVQQALVDTVVATGAYLGVGVVHDSRSVEQQSAVAVDAVSSEVQTQGLVTDAMAAAAAAAKRRQLQQGSVGSEESGRAAARRRSRRALQSSPAAANTYAARRMQ